MPTQTKFAIEGHTDSKFTEKFNQKLSEKRATSVLNFLTSNGIEASRLSTVGFGETAPVASNDTSEGRAQNRRVEVKLSN
jgi:outer membrane protein OmpA-like peptidoglycan-associated protein